MERGGVVPTYTPINDSEDGGGAANDVSSLKAALVHEGFPTLAAAARTRAAAVYYGFGMLSFGFLIVLVFALRESAKWRGTLEGESGAWREFVKAEIHAMGLA